MVGVEDPSKRAIIASAYPFLKQFPNYADFFETWDFKSLNDFALHDVQGTVVLLIGRVVSKVNSQGIFGHRGPKPSTLTEFDL